jgi:starvation-inducible DNA-binding protein
MRSTRNDLPSAAKQTTLEVFAPLVMAAVDLSLATKQAHWNLRGPAFLSVHTMLDGLADQLAEHVDALAERMVQLGGVAVGTVQEVASRSFLAAYPTDLRAVSEHLSALADRFAALGAKARQATDRLGDDAAGADVLTAFCRDLDKALWFLEAHLG